MAVMVEFRCPSDSRRMFGKADPGGTGTVEYRCRDCRNRAMAGDPRWRGQVVHSFDVATGSCVRTVTLTADAKVR